MLERRNSKRYGENHPAATLTDKEVETVRKLREDEHLTYDQIAAIMECSKSTVAGICQNRRRNPRTEIVERWRRKESAGCA